MLFSSMALTWALSLVSAKACGANASMDGPRPAASSPFSPFVRVGSSPSHPVPVTPSTTHRASGGLTDLGGHHVGVCVRDHVIAVDGDQLGTRQLIGQPPDIVDRDELIAECHKDHRGHPDLGH